MGQAVGKLANATITGIITGRALTRIFVDKLRAVHRVRIYSRCSRLPLVISKIVGNVALRTARSKCFYITANIITALRAASVFDR